MIGSRPFTTEGHNRDAHRRFPMGAVLGTAGQSMLLTLAGAAGMILSAFLVWVRPDDMRGTDLSYRVFYRTTLAGGPTFFRSAGGVAIAIGFFAVIGLAFRAGWLTRLAGALGIIAFGLFTITMYRMGTDVPTAFGAGPWFLLGGGIVAMFGGFVATRPKMIVTKS